MRPPSLGAVFSLSVDLDSHLDRAGDSLPEQIRVLVCELTEMFASAGQVVTWTAADPANSAAIDWIRHSGSPHEVALSVPADWLQSNDSRRRISTELVARATQARRSGIALTTLALAVGPPTESDEIEHRELLVKHGFTAVRVAGIPARAGLRSRAPDSSARPTVLRYGLWQIAPYARLSGIASPLAQWLLCRQLRRAIDRSIRGGWPLHLAIDGPSLACHSTRERLAVLRGVLRHVKRRREEGALSVLTCAQTIKRVSAPRMQMTAKSILRAA